MRAARWIVAALLASAAAVASAHSGGLNAQGCHTNKKTGEYHCHRPQSPPPASAQPAHSEQSGVVKMSRSGTCHDPSSPYYSRTTNFTPYETLDACLKAGGRLPK